MATASEAAYRPLTLRRATAADVMQMTAIEEASFTDPWSAHALADAIASPLIIVTIAESADTASTVLGYSVLGYSVLAWAGDEAELLNLAVRSEARRRGVGRALLDRAVEDARQWGASGIFLEVRASNSAARKLYEEAGFAQIGVRAGYYRRPVEDALILRRGTSD